MCDPRVTALALEIRDLYARQSELASAINADIEANARRLTHRFVPPHNESIPELQYFSDIYDARAGLTAARRDPRVVRRVQLVQFAAWIFVFLACMMTFRVTTSPFLL